MTDDDLYALGVPERFLGLLLDLRKVQGSGAGGTASGSPAVPR